jgi:L-iditol 2-dehydrogenase
LAALHAGWAFFPDAGGGEAKAIRVAFSGLAAAIVVAGANAAVDAAVDAVRPGARVVLAGIPAEARTTFVAATARRKGLTLALARLAARREGLKVLVELY